MIHNRRTITNSKIVVFTAYLSTLIVVTVIQRSIDNNLKMLWKNIAVT
jgi:hypothetical protein